jgi:TetR/AcrR family transcriptional regulator, repressor for uid operon
MPKLKPETQTARREHILNAAQLCFARAGFHRTTMHDICREASVSPGAIYVYFDGKEALIAGLCERDRKEFADRVEALEAAPDFLSALATIGQHYFVDEPAHRRLFVVEMSVEATRNKRIAEIFHSVDRFCQERFVALFERLKREGRIAPKVDIKTLAAVFNVMGDGLFWRRAVHPDFQAGDVLPTMLAMLEALICPVPTGPQASHGP